MFESLVSVIIPVYNAEKSIKRCIDSISGQTYKNLQIICVDDGSLDKSVEIIQSLKKEDGRIEIICKTNGGVSSARNYGLEKATGKYVQFVDSDDEIHERMIETLVLNLEKMNVDLVICGYQLKGTEKTCSLNRKEYKNINMFYEDFLEMYQKTYLNPPWNKLYIREKIKYKYDESMSLGEDLVFNLNYINNISTILRIPESLYIYTPGTEGSLTIKFHENGFQSLKKIILKIKNTVPEEQYFLIRDRISNCYFNDYIRCLNSLINKSNKDYDEINKLVYEWNKDELVQEDILIYNENNKLSKIIKSYDSNALIRYFKIINIKNKIVNKIKNIMQKIIVKINTKRSKNVE